MEQRIAYAKELINKLTVSLTLFSFSQTFLYLNCGSTTKLTFPLKIRVKHKKFKEETSTLRKRGMRCFRQYVLFDNSLFVPIHINDVIAP